MIVELFASAHGRHAGVVRGGASRKMAGMLQPGNRVMATWRARLEDHLGSFTLEPLQSRAVILSDRQALAGLNAATALLRFTLPEREPHDALFAASEALFDAMAEGGDWVPLYLRWELGLLEEMGYGLDLSSCAVTGSRDDLAYVSPRSGRAVSRAGAGEWAPKLLPLPLCLLGQGPASLAEIVQGLRLTGFFLGERMAPDLGDRPLPEARQRFVDLLGRSAR
jgi:DNA repair protein RecO (recombination protein O)